MQVQETHNADLKSPLIDLETDNTVTGGKQELTSSVQPERLSEANNYCMYWLHSPKHTDPFCEGYVGITRNFKERMKAHKKNKKKQPIVDAIKKYGWENIQKTILVNTLTLNEALYLEAYYRPNEGIGWNCQKGGELGVEPSWYSNKDNKLKHSLNTSSATKKGIRLNDTTEARSQRAKLNHLLHKDAYKAAVKGSKNGKAQLNEEQVYTIKSILFPQGKSNREIADLFNVKIHVIQFIRSGKNWKHVICDSPAHK